MPCMWRCSCEQGPDPQAAYSLVRETNDTQMSKYCQNRVIGARVRVWVLFWLDDKKKKSLSIIFDQDQVMRENHAKI